jgi:uncharacterized membrane protein
MEKRMQIDKRELKHNAKMLIRESKPSMMLVGLLFVAILLLFSFLNLKLSGYGDLAVWETFQSYLEAGDSERALSYFYSIQPTRFESIISYALNLAQALLNAGFVIFVMNSVRKESPTVYNLLDGFVHFFRVIILSLIQGLIVSLLSVFLIVPGIIAAYCYRFSLYLLIDHPELTVFQCLSLSRNMMRGHKWELFLLDLSMIGPILLFVFLPVTGFYVLPYLYSVWILYYEQICEKFFPELHRTPRDDPEDLPPSDLE